MSRKIPIQDFGAFLDNPFLMSSAKNSVIGKDAYSSSDGEDEYLTDEQETTDDAHQFRALRKGKHVFGTEFDCEQKHSYEGKNPVFDELSEARKTIYTLRYEYEKNKKRARKYVDEDEEEESFSSSGSWRFSGAIQSDPEEEADATFESRSDEDEIVSPSTAARKRDLILDTPPYMFFNPENRKKTKRQKTLKNISKMPEEIKALGLQKYWKSRYQLFSLYDQGIKLDHESWFSVTPEDIAIHIANRCATNGIIIDAFCGCGGNTIHFAKQAGSVIAIDIDPVKIDNARHNARIYGVEDNITFVVADFMKLAPVLKGDIVFLSPPWGGPKYSKAEVFDIETMIPMDGKKVFELAQQITTNIVYYLPRNVDREQLAYLSGRGHAVEIEQNCVEGHIKALTAYYGELIDTNSLT